MSRAEWFWSVVFKGIFAFFFFALCGEVNYIAVASCGVQWVHLSAAWRTGVETCVSKACRRLLCRRLSTSSAVLYRLSVRSLRIIVACYAKQRSGRFVAWALLLDNGKQHGMSLSTTFWLVWRWCVRAGRLTGRVTTTFRWYCLITKYTISVPYTIPRPCLWSHSVDTACRQCIIHVGLRLYSS